MKKRNPTRNNGVLIKVNIPAVAKDKDADKISKNHIKEILRLQSYFCSSMGLTDEPNHGISAPTKLDAIIQEWAHDHEDKSKWEKYEEFVRAGEVTELYQWYAKHKDYIKRGAAVARIEREAV